MHETSMIECLAILNSSTLLVMKKMSAIRDAERKKIRSSWSRTRCVQLRSRKKLPKKAAARSMARARLRRPPFRPYKFSALLPARRSLDSSLQSCSWRHELAPKTQFSFVRSLKLGWSVLTRIRLRSHMPVVLSRAVATLLGPRFFFTHEQ